MKEQIAGDALEPVTSEGIVAASLLVCGSYDQAGNAQSNAVQRATSREEEMEDLVSVVGQTFLGLTINCARCHDHKFDPIPQTDYYRIKAVFDGVKHGERSIEDPAEARAREGRVAALKQQIADSQREARELETIGRNLAGSKRHDPPAVSGPVPFALWRFAGPTDVASLGELKGSAIVSDGVLALPKDGSYFQSAPLESDIHEKTLEAWVSLSDLAQGGGAAISIENSEGTQFDAIVFGEREQGKWTAGSDGFQRTANLSADVETTPIGGLIHMAIVYRDDNSVALFRNGEVYGKP